MKAYIFWHVDRVEEVRGGNLVDEVSDSLRNVPKTLVQRKQQSERSPLLSLQNYFLSVLYLVVKSSFLVRAT